MENLGKKMKLISIATSELRGTDLSIVVCSERWDGPSTSPAGANSLPGTPA